VLGELASPNSTSALETAPHDARAHSEQIRDLVDGEAVLVMESNDQGIMVR